MHQTTGSPDGHNHFVEGLLMELHRPTPTPHSNPPVTAYADREEGVEQAVDYKVPSRGVAAAGAVAPTDAVAPTEAAASAVGGGHDDTLVPAAMEEIEMQRAHVEGLLEAGVLGKCLSD
jgi:hypothetical protein